jgi:hypothetical protein
LGENGIISLVDNLKSNRNVKIEDTDLYYHVKCSFKDYEIDFFSRGLILLTKKARAVKLGNVIGEAARTKASYRSVMKSLLTKYQLSLIEIFGGFESVPIHLTIAFDEFEDASYYLTTSSSIDEDSNNTYNQKILDVIVKDKIGRDFIGNLRSKHSREYEDVIIGTEGSIVRSEQVDILLSYHAYTRALHLFLRKFNQIIEGTWRIINETTSNLEDLDRQFNKEAKEAESLGVKISRLFSASTAHDKLREARSRVLSKVKDLEQIPILTKFVQDSVDFTREKYVDEREKKMVKENSFHVRKTLKVLADRSKHLSLVSENLRARGTTLLSQLELFDSEVIYSLSHRFEIMSITIAVIGIAIAVIAIPLALIALF